MKNKTKKSVSIVIVTIGKKNYLQKCLGCIKNQNYPVAQVVVIDNSLDPEFRKKIRNDFPWIELYPNSLNLLYALSLNKGIKLSRGEFILCLNDDTFLDKNFILEAIKGFWQNKNIGMVAGKILRRNKKTLDSTGLFLSLFRTAKERGYGKPDTGQFQKKGFVFGASGAAALYRRKMLDRIKEDNEYFDPDLGMFYEDLDLAWRANRLGWKGFYVPEAIAYHVRGGSFRPNSGLDKPLARRYLNSKLYAGLIKNRYLVIIKNERISNFIFHLIPFILYDLTAWIYTCIFHPKVIKIFLSNRKVLNAAIRKRSKTKPVN